MSTETAGRETWVQKLGSVWKRLETVCVNSAVASGSLWLFVAVWGGFKWFFPGFSGSKNLKYFYSTSWCTPESWGSGNKVLNEGDGIKKRSNSTATFNQAESALQVPVVPPYNPTKCR